jgi:two-component system, chemotaxis family, CheB/CheR fusion protein
MKKEVNQKKTAGSKEPAGRNKQEEKASPRRKAFPVVGIGASAGGLEPLEAFFAHMPTDKPPAVDLAFVIIQHLSPTQKTMIGDILKKDTDMPIAEIQDGMELKPNNVYFNPPAKEVVIYQGVFHLVEPSEARYVRLPIDFFFRSLAQDLKEKAICIVLSGTGSDGTQGLEAVKGAGGMTIAQSEEQAAYPFMPRSAIDTGLVDYILPAERMPEEIIRYVQHPYLDSRARELTADNHYQSFLQKILMLVRAKTRHDFSHYKQTTISRRIGRRMAVHKIEGIADYFLFLQENLAEIQALFKDLVICVTSFFRDPEAFKVLETRVIPDILARHPAGEPIRVWVPGCGTGEEALSIAILIEEVMEKVSKRFSVQIFATDIDSEAVEKARVGLHPESIEADVSPERLKKFFVKQDGGYQIKKELRDLVVYAPQNLISDPPFSRLDLISCRNVLIYLNNDLQKKIMSIFHFTLVPRGYLFLGPSETIGVAADLFAPVDLKWKIFQRKDTMQRELVDFPVTKPPAEALRLPRNEPASREVDARTIMEKIVLEEYAPPSVLINKHYEVLYLQGATGKFLTMPKGKPSFNFLNLVREDLRSKLIPIVHKSLSAKTIETAKSIPYRQPEGGLGNLNLTVRPFTAPNNDDLFLVVFEEHILPQEPVKGKGKGTGKGKPPATAAEESRVAFLEQELQGTKDYLQVTVEELQASNEEFKSINEELQSTNEELQSSNEELETAQEELQSTNEELVTVNSELTDKIDELTNISNDIDNLLNSTEIGTLFLDKNLRLKRFTPAATSLFNLLPQDVGRSIKDIAPKTAYERLWHDAESVLHSLQVKEFEVKSHSGVSFNIRILPYRTREGSIDGVVITFMDISAPHLLAMAKNFAKTMADSLREPLMILDGDLKVIVANQPFYDTFQTQKENTENRMIYALGDGHWDIPKLRELLEEIIPQNSSFKNFQVEHNFPKIGKKIMLLNAHRIPAVADNTSLVLLAIEDITERHNQELEFRETVARLEKEVAELKGQEH